MPRIRLVLVRLTVHVAPFFSELLRLGLHSTVPKPEAIKDSKPWRSIYHLPSELQGVDEGSAEG